MPLAVRVPHHITHTKGNMTTQTAYERMRRYFSSFDPEERVKAQPESGVGCRYRTDDGKCCAVGALIPPDMYDRGMDEGHQAGGVYSIQQYFPEVADFLGIDGDNLGQWAELQSAHDNSDGTAGDIVRRLDFTAGRLGLELSPR